MRLVRIVTLLVFTAFFQLKAYDGLLFRPLTADPFEPRVGSVYHFGEKKLRLDIGTSVDLYDIKPNSTGEIHFGTDFMTYTRLRTEGNFKFPVETSDYFFGINSSYKDTSGIIKSSARLRIAHISSHMVDGLSDSTIFRRRPFVYSREFVDAVYAASYINLRAYIGFIYVFSTKPKDVESIIPQMGLDYNINIYKFIDFSAGYDFKIVGIDKKYAPMHSLQAGFLFRTWENKGIFIGGYYFSGRSMHGEFYKDYDNYLGVGFQVIGL